MTHVDFAPATIGNAVILTEDRASAVVVDKSVHILKRSSSRYGFCRIVARTAAAIAACNRTLPLWCVKLRSLEPRRSSFGQVSGSFTAARSRVFRWRT